MEDGEDCAFETWVDVKMSTSSRTCSLSAARMPSSRNPSARSTVFGMQNAKLRSSLSTSRMSGSSYLFGVSTTFSSLNCNRVEVSLRTSSCAYSLYTGTKQCKHTHESDTPCARTIGTRRSMSFCAFARVEARRRVEAAREAAFADGHVHSVYTKNRIQRAPARAPFFLYSENLPSRFTCATRVSMLWHNSSALYCANCFRISVDTFPLNFSKRSW